jgi:hypothetical protein
MTRPKDVIWSHFEVMFRGRDEVSKTQYCNCKACDDAVIAASSACMWAGRTIGEAIGQLDAGFMTCNPRKKTKQLPATIPPPFNKKAVVQQHTVLW